MVSISASNNLEDSVSSQSQASKNMTDSNRVDDTNERKNSKEAMTITKNKKTEDSVQHPEDPDGLIIKKLENLGDLEELYTMLSAVKRRRTSKEFGVSPIMPIRSDVENEEKINLLQKDAQLRNSLSIDDGCASQSTFISKAVIREAEKVFLQDQEKYLWVEVFENNMYLAVTWSTGNKENPFVVKFFQYERTYVRGDDINNSDIFNGIAIGIQEYINTSYIEKEFEEQDSIPIVFCFSDYVKIPSLMESIAERVGIMSTFNGEIVRKNYCKEFAETIQLIITKKKIEFTTIVPIYSGNFMSFYCFDKFKEDKRPHANYDFLRGLAVQEFLKCPKVRKQNLSGTNLERIYPDSVLQGEGSNCVLISNSFYRIGQYKGFQRDIIYKFLTKFERFNFDTNANLGIDLYSQLASPLRQAIHLQNYIRNHPLYLISPQLEEEPVVTMERFEYFLQDDYKDKGSILHPYTFKLIGAEINRFCKFVMKRCLSFSALAVLATIEKKYYEDIEPKYKSGSTPKVIISIREDDRGLSNGFEKTIVEYLDNGASLFWKQRRQDLESPKFEIISDLDTSFSGSHILTKYLRTLIPHDYWVQNATKIDKERLEERKKSYRIALDAHRYSRKQEDDLVKQLINNISGMDSFEEIDLSTINNTGEMKSSLEKMCGIEDMGEIESITIGSISKTKEKP